MKIRGTARHFAARYGVSETIKKKPDPHKEMDKPLKAIESGLRHETIKVAR